MALTQDDASISDDETLYRRISELFVQFDENLARPRPSTQAFKQGGPDGLVSVYLCSETTPEAVMSEGPEKWLATIEVGALRSLGLGIVRSPSDGGPGHCDITGRKTRGALRRIAASALWVPGYAPI